MELRRVGTGKNLMLAYHGPAMAHPDAAALEVMSGILAGRGGTGINRWHAIGHPERRA